MENVDVQPQLQTQLLPKLEINEAQFICDFCSRSFKRKDRLQTHLKVHTGDRPYICGVPGCCSSYTRLQHLQRHIERVHFAQNTVLSKLECPQCNALLANPECLKRHEQRFHSPSAQGKLFECPEEGCNEVFRKKTLLITHRERDHGTTNADRCHKCPVEGCDKTFPFPTVLRRHMKVHQGYECDVDGCGGVFETYFKLRKHKAVEHGPDLVCRQCQIPFKSRQTLVQHLKTHLFVKEVFRCTEAGCERTFLYKKNLKQHIRAYHLGERVFTRKKIPKEKPEEEIPPPKLGVKKSSAGFLSGINDRAKSSPESPLDLSVPCNDEQDQNPSCSFEDILHKFYPPSEHSEPSSDMDYESDPFQNVKSIIDESVKSIFEKKDSVSSDSAAADTQIEDDLSESAAENNTKVKSDFLGTVAENNVQDRYDLPDCGPQEKDDTSSAFPFNTDKDNMSVFPFQSRRDDSTDSIQIKCEPETY